MLLQRKRNTRRASAPAPRRRLPALNWRRIGLSLAGLAVSALALASLFWLLDQPIQRVIVSGRLQRVSALDVEKIVRDRLRGAGLVTVDLENIRGGLRTLPWVDSATVQRSWPRALRIEIVEQAAVARWNDSGLLNARGQLFMSEAHFVPPELPQLFGLPGSEAEAVLDIGGAVGELRAEPVCFKRAYCKVPGKGEVHASARLQGEDIGIRLSGSGGRKGAVQAMRFSDQRLPEEADALLEFATQRMRPGVAGAKGGRDHR